MSRSLQWIFHKIICILVRIIIFKMLLKLYILFFRTQNQKMYIDSYLILFIHFNFFAIQNALQMKQTDQNIWILTFSLSHITSMCPCVTHTHCCETVIVSYFHIVYSVCFICNTLCIAKFKLKHFFNESNIFCFVFQIFSIAV